MHDDQLRSLFRTLERADEPDPAFADALFERLTSTAARPAGRRAPSLLLAAALLVAALGASVAVGSGLIKLPGLSREPLPAPTASTSTQPTQPVATATPPATASPTPTVEATPSEPAPDLAGDDLVETAVDGLSVRAGTGVASQKLRSLAAGEQAFVIGGPRDADGYWWYRLSGLGVPLDSGCVDALTCPSWTGWVAAADLDGTPWLVPSSMNCPESPMNVAELGPGLSNLQRLVCYGNDSITFRGYWPTLPPDAGLGGVCELPHGEPAWLECPTYTALDPQASGGEGSLGYLPLYVDPGTGVAMPERGRWVEVTAHLDDPAAEGCATPNPPDLDAAQHLLQCRSKLVVESVRGVDGPY